MRATLLLGLALLSGPGCRGGAPAEIGPHAGPPTSQASPRAGFVIYTVDDDAVTSWVVPFTTTSGELRVTPATRLDGAWLQDDDGPAPRVTVWNVGAVDDQASLSAAAAEQLWAARCAPGARGVEKACTWPPREVVTTFDDAGRPLAQLVDDTSCSCFDLPVADLAVLRAGEYASVDSMLAEEEEDGEEDEALDEELAACEEVRGPLTHRYAALVGGVMQELVTYDNEGCSGVRVVSALVHELALLPKARLPKVEIADEARCEEGQSGEVPWDPLVEVVAEAEEEQTCAPMQESIWSIHRGRLVRSDVGTDPFVSCACHSRVPVRAQLCPSTADPCGRLEAFPALERRDDDFWITTDERAALVVGEAASIVAKGGQASARVQGFRPGPEADVVGVRYHADVEPLLRAAAAALKPESRALAWLPVALRSTVTVAAPALAPEDADRVERRGGRDFGNRCFSHFKARRFDAAEAACARGLESATEPTVRAAIFYSLGRIAEARGDDWAARVYYRTSLALRGDEETERRFVRLGSDG